MSSPWIQHIQQYRASNPHLSYKQAMVEAKGSYRSIPKSVVPLEGGKLNIKKTANKISHGAKKVHLGNKALTVARVSAPVLTVMAPEIGLPISAALIGIDNAKKANKKRGGSFKAHGKSTEGGSFRVHGAGVLQSSSHIMHPSFYPLKPKSYKQLQHEN